MTDRGRLPIPLEGVAELDVRHEEERCEVPASPAVVFDHVDRPERLSAHMSRRSWRLAGTSMSIEPDAQGGRAVGSHIRLRGRVLGLALDAECVVVERIVPRLKQWQTVGRPRLLVIGPYRMAVRIEPYDAGSRVAVAIDYALPSALWERLLGRALAAPYARWCVRQMARDIERRFALGLV